jgi:hypothetical protein
MIISLIMGWLQGEQGSMVDRKERRPPSDSNSLTTDAPLHCDQ